jgi:hypothetical protein
MKHLFQFVAFIILALLTVPPSVVEGLCLISQTPTTASMECCNVDHVGTPAAAPAIVQSCDEGCCSVVPQNSPAPIISDKFKVDSAGPATFHNLAVLSLHTPRELAMHQIYPTDRTQDLPILLQTFRI